MPWAHHAEVSSIDHRDLGHAEAFCRCDDRGVDRPERQVVVLRHQFDHAERIGGVDRLKHERAVGDVAEEAGFRLPAEPCP
jgi:hypothetical protein